jgi:hypothetical protein
MLYFFHSSKCFVVVTVPPTRFSLRTDQYCSKVRVPSMEGLLTRVLWKISYVPSSDVNSPFSVHGSLGASSGYESTM